MLPSQTAHKILLCQPRFGSLASISTSGITLRCQIFRRAGRHSSDHLQHNTRLLFVDHTPMVCDLQPLLLIPLFQSTPTLWGYSDQLCKLDNLIDKKTLIVFLRTISDICHSWCDLARRMRQQTPRADGRKTNFNTSITVPYFVFSCQM